MTIFKPIIPFLFLLPGTFQNLTAQNNSRETSKFELGIDFVKFNRNWIYYNDLLYPVNNSKYNFDLTPSFFARVHLEYFSLRLRYEHLKTPYLFRSNPSDLNKEVDGIFSNNRYLVGIEKNIFDSRIKSYVFIDLGLSGTNFNGSYSESYGDPIVTISESFNIKGIGLSVQPGLGIKYRLFSNLYIDLESSVYFEKGADKNDTHNINPQNKLIPRPISLFGFSTNF
jgi:hypothetical protein